MFPTVVRASLCAILLAGAACGPPSGPGPTVVYQPGILASDRGDEVIVAPERGTVGVPLLVVVRTRGGGCVRKGEAQSHVDGLTADVTPFDYFTVILPPNSACTRELRIFSHEASVVFDRAGVATIRAHGRRDPDGSPIVLSRTIIIE